MLMSLQRLIKSMEGVRFGDPLETSSTHTVWETATLATLLERQSNQALIVLTSSPANLQALRDAVTLPARTLP